MKFPRTYHLPFSETLTSDDKYIESLSIFEGKEVVVTEKMDGENFSLYRDKLHARSEDSKHHESRSWIKQFYGKRKFYFPEGLQVIGENLYAKHSILYTDLPSYFLAFAIIYKNDRLLSWHDTEMLCQQLDIKTVPVLYKGTWNINELKKCFIGKSKFGNEQEGYVVRLACQIAAADWSKSAAKFVRKNHIQTDKHWMEQKIVKNKLEEPLDIIYEKYPKRNIFKSNRFISCV